MQRKVAKVKDGNVGKNDKGDGKVVVGKRGRKMRGGGETFKQYCETFVKDYKSKFDEASRFIFTKFKLIEKIINEDTSYKTILFGKSDKRIQQLAAIKYIKSMTNENNHNPYIFDKISFENLIDVLSYIDEDFKRPDRKIIYIANGITNDYLQTLYKNIFFLKIFKLIEEFKHISQKEEITSEITIEKAGDKDSNIMKGQIKSNMPHDDVANEQENLQESLKKIDISKETLNKEEMIENSKYVVKILNNSSRFKKIMEGYPSVSHNIKTHIEYMLFDFMPLILENKRVEILKKKQIKVQLKTFQDMINYKEELNTLLAAFIEGNTDDDFAKKLLLDAYELMMEILPFLIKIFEKHLAFLNNEKTETSPPTKKVKVETGANDAGWGSFSVSKSKERDKHNKPFDTRDSEQQHGDGAWVRKLEGDENSTIVKIYKIFNSYSYPGYYEWRQKYNRLDEKMKDLIDNNFFVITQEEMEGLTNETNLDYNAIDRKIKELETFNLDENLKIVQAKLVEERLDKEIAKFPYTLGKTIKNECLEILRKHSALLKSKVQTRLSEMSVAQQSALLTNGSPIIYNKETTIQEIAKVYNILIGTDEYYKISSYYNKLNGKIDSEGYVKNEIYQLLLYIYKKVVAILNDDDDIDKIPLLILEISSKKVETIIEKINSFNIDEVEKGLMIKHINDAYKLSLIYDNKFKDILEKHLKFLQEQQTPSSHPEQNDELSISDDDGMDDGIERNALLRIFEDIYEQEVNDYITGQYKLYTENGNKIITDYMNEQLFTKYKEAKKLITRGLPELEIDSRIDEISNFISTITEENVDEAKTQIMKKINSEAMDDNEIAIAFINHVYTRIQKLNQIYTTTLEKYKEELTNSKQSVNDPLSVSPTYKEKLLPLTFKGDNLLSILDKLKLNDVSNNEKVKIAKSLKDRYTNKISIIEQYLKTFDSQYFLKQNYMEKVKPFFDKIISVAFKILNNNSINYANKEIPKIVTYHTSSYPLEIFIDMEKNADDYFIDSQAGIYLKIIERLKKELIDFEAEIYNDLDILVKNNEQQKLNIWTGGGRQTRKPPRKEPITKTPKMKDPKQKEPTKTLNAKEPTKTPKQKEPKAKDPKPKEPTKTPKIKEPKPKEPTKTPKIKEPKPKEPTKTPKIKEPKQKEPTKTPKQNEPTKTPKAKEPKPTKTPKQNEPTKTPKAKEPKPHKPTKK